MEKKLFLVLLIIALVSFGCAQQPVAPVQQPKSDVPAQQEAAKPANVGVQIKETQEKNIQKEVQELFDKASEKTTSMHYRYRAPETQEDVYEFFVNDNLIRYIYQHSVKDVNLDKDAFNAVYLDAAKKTAEGYCDAQTCIEKGLKKSLPYNDAYIDTPLDWIAKVQTATKLGEEQIDRKKTWKLDTDIGLMHIDSYSGLPLRIVDGIDKYEFIGLVANGVKDEEVRP